MTLSRLEKQIVLSEKQYILGRREKAHGGMLNIGRYYALDGSLGAPVYLDALHPHVIFVCGKRGYGKSYTIGVILEEITCLEPHVKQSLGVIVFDTLGIFWTTQFPSTESSKIMDSWGRKPQQIHINLLVPKHAVKEYTKKGLDVECFSVRVADLSPIHWCHLFDIKTVDPVGVALTRAILELQSSFQTFSIEEILQHIQKDDRAENAVKCAVENLFIQAASWDFFHKEGLSISEIIRRETLTVLDLSHLHSPILKDIVVSLVSEKIFEERVKERKIHEQKKIGFSVEERGIPQVWLAIDEAQVFMPHGKKTLSKEILIDEWMRQGRQPGLSLIIATQRPSAIEQEVLSHSDIIICHRMTAQEDIDALCKIRPTFMHGDIGECIKKMGTEKGVALLVDDTSESVHIVKVRPRFSWHGGSEPVLK